MCLYGVPRNIFFFQHRANLQGHMSVEWRIPVPCGKLIILSPVVTIYATCFDMKNLSFTAEFIYWLRYFLHWTAIVTLYSINCLVRPSLNKPRTNKKWTILVAVIAQTVCCWLLVTETRVDPRAVHVGFMMYWVVLWQVFLQVLGVFLLLSFYRCSILIFINLP
jgi:hypothetical protein